MNSLRRLSIAAILSLATTALVGPPAWSSTRQVDCFSGSTVTGSFTITDTTTNSVVTSSSSCAGSATIPNGVTSIGNSAFLNATALTSITIPNSVTTIGNSAFFNTSLYSITIPDSVNSIGYGAFELATKLTTVNFGADSSLTSIGPFTFSSASSLFSITIPNSVTTIGYAAFYNASSLTSITIPNSVTTIGNYAFYDASSLATVNFDGNAPLSVASNAFQNVKASAVAGVCAHATGFGAPSTSWNGLTVTIATCPGLTPSLSTSTSTADGYTLQITNYDSNYTWLASVSSGSAAIDGTGVVTVTGVSAGGSSNLTITTTRQYYTALAASVTATALDAPAVDASAVDAPVQPNPYTGPLPSNYSDRTPSIGDEVVVSGKRLNLVTSCTIDGVTAVMSNHSADSFTIEIPAGLEPGPKDLVMTGPAGKLTAQGAFTVQQTIPAITNETPTASKTNAGSFNGYVAVYAKGHKGKILSWKIAGKWFKTSVTSDYQVFQRRTIAVGQEVKVDLFIDGERLLAKTVLTR